jgi:catechol 2,3-dioxygenase-like lactoylglutathione lyase family enzyme
MEILGIDVAFYHADDIEASAAWYRDVLGLREVADFGDWREFEVGGERFAVDSGTPATEIPNAVVSFRVADLDAAVAELAARGIAPAHGIVDAGPTRFVTLADPAGNLVQLSQPKT